MGGGGGVEVVWGLKRRFGGWVELWVLGEALGVRDDIWGDF